MQARRLQVRDFDWFKTDYREVLAVETLLENLEVNLRAWKPHDSWQRRSHQDSDTKENLGCAGALALENSKGAQADGDHGDDWDRTRAQNSSVAEEERRTAPRSPTDFAA